MLAKRAGTVGFRHNIGRKGILRHNYGTVSLLSFNAGYEGEAWKANSVCFPSGTLTLLLGILSTVDLRSSYPTNVASMNLVMGCPNAKAGVCRSTDSISISFSSFFFFCSLSRPHRSLGPWNAQPPGQVLPRHQPQRAAGTHEPDRGRGLRLLAEVH